MRLSCAGCGAPLPDTEAIVVDVLAADLRCDLCWRAMLAAEAAASRREGAAAVDEAVKHLSALMQEWIYCELEAATL